MHAPSSPDLEALDAYLSSDASPDNCMQLSDLDGFLTAIAVAPELDNPSEWLPEVWGEEMADFASDEQAEAVIGAMVARYNEILSGLMASPPSVDPVFWETADGDVVAGDWAAGFVIGMRLRAKAWESLIQDEENNFWLLPIFALVGPDTDDLNLEAEIDDQEKLVDEAPHLIPSSVIAIDRYWKQGFEAGGGETIRFH